MSDEWIDCVIEALADHLRDGVDPGRYAYGVHSPTGRAIPLDEIEETGSHEIPARYSRTGQPNPLTF